MYIIVPFSGRFRNLPVFVLSLTFLLKASTGGNWIVAVERSIEESSSSLFFPPNTPLLTGILPLSGPRVFLRGVRISGSPIMMDKI